MARISIVVCHSATRSSLAGSSAQPGRYAPAAPRNFRSALLRRLFPHEIFLGSAGPPSCTPAPETTGDSVIRTTPHSMPWSEPATRHKARNQGIAHHQIPRRPAQLHRTSASAPARNPVCLPWTRTSAGAGVSASSDHQRTFTSANPSCSPADQTRKKESETNSVVVLKAANKPMNSHDHETDNKPPRPHSPGPKQVTLPPHPAQQ